MRQLDLVYTMAFDWFLPNYNVRFLISFRCQNVLLIKTLLSWSHFNKPKLWTADYYNLFSELASGDNFEIITVSLSLGFI